MNANKILVLKACNTALIVRLVERGDSYGKNFCLTNSTHDDYVEFYDPRNPFTNDSDFGYFIARYYKQNIMECKGGIRLYGDDPAWQISDEDMEKVRKWLTN
jgi:hypothetical protein